MEFEQLSELLFSDIKLKLESHNGLCIFAKERSKFEGWLKVELCDSIIKYFEDVTPEKMLGRRKVDVTFDDWAIELKTVSTNIRYENVKNKTCTITMNTEGVIKDITKLKSSDYKHKAVLFVAFPIEHDNKNWQDQLQKITDQLTKIEHVEFKFKEDIPGVLYLGLV